MSDFEVVTKGNPLYAELDRLKREQNELQSAFEDAVTRAEKAEGERDALADALREYMRAGVGNSTHYEIQSNALNLARATLAQVRK